METRKFIPRLTFNRVVVGLAAVAVIGSGTAYAANEWTGANIVDGSLTAADLANETIGSNKIKNESIISSDIKNESISSNDILDGTINGPDLKNQAVTGAKVKDSSLGTADVINGSLSGDDITDESLTSADLATDSVQATEVADDSIDSGEIVDFGLSNEDIGVLYAQVNGDGTLANSSGGVTSSRFSTGTYEVSFGVDVSSCAFTGTVGEAGIGGASPGMVGVTDRSGNPNGVFVRTNSGANAAADLSFQLVVVC